MLRRTAFILLAAIGIGLLGCGPKGPETGTGASERGQDRAAREPTGPGPVPSPAPDPAPPKPDPAPASPGVNRSGEDLEILLRNITGLVWSPSGRLAVVQTDTRNYLLDAEKPGLDPLPLDSGNIRFWSDTELLWTPRGPKGDLMLRDLTTGKDRILHPSETSLIHTLKPGDLHLTYLVSTGAGPHGIFGKIFWAKLGDPTARLLLENARLVGRMADGRVIAIEAIGAAGPLWVISPDGTKTLLAAEPAHFPTLSPDGKRLLWFTGPAPKQTSWLDLLKPSVAHASEPYDPPLTDLWVWEGSGEPRRLPLGCTCSANAIFSPDSRRIAVSINEAFMMQQEPKPGRIAVIENGTMKEIARFDDRTTAPLWLGNDGVNLRPTIREKTGGMPPLLRLTLDGKVSTDPADMWFMDGPKISRRLGGDRWDVTWETGETAEYRRGSTENPNRGISLKPRDPYIALIWEDRAILRKVTWK